MTAFDPRVALLAAAALSLVGGLSACTAAPRFPVLQGEAAGGGIEPLQARYPVRAAETQAESDPASEAEPAPRPAAARDIAPRAAPTPEVDVSELSSPPSATPWVRERAAVPARTAETFSAAAPASERPLRLAQATPGTSPGPVPVGEDALPLPATGSAPPSFIQRDTPGGPPRFTIGAPVPAPPVVVAPAPPAPPVLYARPSAPVSTPSPPATTGSASTMPATSGSGPRPYTSLFPQGPTRPVRSAGIRSTPSNPGIAPQALSVPPGAESVLPSTTEAAARGRGVFRWPLQGQLISGFGDKGGGQRNDGLNIAANLGDPVQAAAAGEVVYAGDQVPGSGKLVLVKHAGGWVTAYAHLSRIGVRMRQPIAQGQEIGQAGQTGGVDRPQLHFEIRYAPSPEIKAAPVDPAALLPSG